MKGRRRGAPVRDPHGPPWSECYRAMWKAAGFRRDKQGRPILADLTLEKVAEVFGLTRERIRQIEESALSKLGITHADDKEAIRAELHAAASERDNRKRWEE